MANEDRDDAQCIGNLEHHLHQLFSRVRVPGDDFVYSSSPDMFSMLDEYCDDSTFHEAKPPLLLLDESGSGKSALLSNWLLNKQRKLAQARKGDEFIFWHAVGCSRQSMNVNSLIRRLMHGLKNRFDLIRDVPFAQDRLSWELPRFFEMASKRGRLIIVIDGIHRLVTNEDTEAGLAWLPLAFPPNVRIILTATELTPSTGIPAFESVSQLPSMSRMGSSLDGSYESKGGEIGEQLNSLSEADLVEAGGGHEYTLAPKGSKILAELKRRKWRSLRVKRMDRAQCRNALETYIHKSVEKETMGYTAGPFLTDVMGPNEQPPLDSAPGFLLFDTQVTKLLTHDLGGTPMFLRLFLQCSHYAVRRGFSLWKVWDAWLEADSVSALLNLILVTIENGHEPTAELKAQDMKLTEDAGALQTLRILYPWHPSFQEAEEEENEGDMEDLELQRAAEARAAKKLIAQDHDNEEANKTLSTKVTENLGDQQWLALGGFAESLLAKTCSNITDVLSSTLEHAHNLVDMGSESHSAAVSVSSMLKVQAEGPTADTIGISNPLLLLESSMKLVEEYATAGIAAESKNAAVNQPSTTEERNLEDVDTSESAKVRAAEAAAQAAAEAAKKEEEASRAAAEEAARQQYISKTAGIETLPGYFLGGTQVSGMGNILGNALALLYVARHGLKESEIWGLLAGLHYMECQELLRKEDRGGGSLTNDGGETQAIVQICYTARGMLEDLCRAEDIGHSGFVSRGVLTTVLHNLHPGLSFTDMLRLLEITSMMVNDSTQYSEDILVDYRELLDRVVVVYERKTASKSKASDTSVMSYEVIRKSNADKQEKRFPSSKHSSRTENFAGSMADPEDGPKSLGPVLEESLLQVLVALGVLHDPTNHVLVLPSDSDVLRQVIYTNYVESRGGEEVWHGHLIRHFQQERNSMRRCEELPWHLQLCRRWHNMKDTLVDLSTFEMMYDSSDLRDEYMSYWVQLTEGPMYITDELHKTAMATQAKQIEEILRNDRSRDPELAKILIQLDTASALNLTEKNARKLLLKNQVCPFDVVEEFNKSMEMWVAKQRPVASQIHDKLLQISKFLAEFSSKNDSQPPFLRLGVEVRALKLFDVDFDCYKEVITEDITDEEINPGMLALTNGEEEGGKKLLETFPGARHTKGGNIYYYLRWMWTQFPWIALNQTVEVGSVCEVGGLASVLAAYAAGARGRGRSGPPRMITSSDIFDDSVVDSSGATDRKNAQDTAIARSTRLWDVKKSDPTKVHFENTKSRKAAFVASILVPQNQKDVMDMNLRKVRDDIANASAAKHKMPGKFRRTMEQELEAMKGIPHAQHCKRSLSRNTLFPSLDAHIKEKNREIEEDGELYVNALATMRLGGPGLPLEAGLEGEIKKLAEAEQMKAWNDRRGGALPVGSERELDYEREFERMVRLRAMANKTTTMLRERTALCDSLRHEAESRDVLDEETADYMRAGEAAIKQLKDKYQMMSDALDEGKRLNNGYKLLIEWLQLTPPFTESHVGQQQNQLTLAKQQLQEMQKLRHNMYMESEREALVKQRQVETKIQYFKEAKDNITRKIEKLFPSSADDDVSVDSLKSLTSTERRKGDHRDAVLMTHDQLEGRLSQSNLRPAVDSVEKAIEKGALMAHGSVDDLTKNISNAIAESADRASSLAEQELDPQPKRKETLKEKAKRMKREREVEEAKLKEYTYDKDSLQQSVVNAIFKTDAEKQREMAAKAKVMQSTMMWEFVMEKTCSTSEDELIERFHDGKRLTETLLGQQNLVDSRLAQLRTEFDEVKGQLSESILNGGDEAEADQHIRSQKEADEQASSAFGQTPDEEMLENPNEARYFENKLNKLEMHLAQVQRQEEMTINRINEVRTGVGHLMTLLNVNKRMLHNLPKSNPPKMVTHEDISTSLSWCEERILAINEAQMVDTTSNKPSSNNGQNADDSKPLFARQTDLAVAVQTMFEKQHEGLPRRQARKPKNSKDGGGMSAMLIHSNNQAAMINSPRGVLVAASSDVDRINDMEVVRIQEDRDKHEEKFEAEQLEAKIDGSGAGIHKFLKEALSTKDAQMMLRKTNLASGSRKGRNSGYGYVLDEFLDKSGLPTRLESTGSPTGVPMPKADTDKKKKKKKKIAAKLAKEGVEGQEVAAVVEED